MLAFKAKLFGGGTKQGGYTLKLQVQAQVRLEKPLFFNLAALLALGYVAQKNPALWSLLQDMVLGTTIAIGISYFALQQAKSALPKDYD